jgi:enamine deaminase RidA (YjgF/YER057c/UK114 family)
MPRATEHHIAPAGLAPGNGYSHVVAATGRIVAVAGQVALDADGNLVGAGEPEAQVRQIFENIGRALAAVGASFGDVIKLTYFVTDASIMPVVREVRDRYLDRQRLPASTAVQVTALVRPEFLLEIEALAVIDDA